MAVRTIGENVDVAAISLEALQELCRSLEEQVSSGMAPLRLYGLLAGVRQELELRSCAVDEDSVTEPEARGG